MLLRFKPKERSPEHRRQDQGIARKILLSLPEADRDIVFRYYFKRQLATDIERELGLSAGYVNQLCSSVKSTFFREKGWKSEEESCPQWANAGARYGRLA
jgi:DNA-directed RNA polymerase specialized sigma subunit